MKPDWEEIFRTTYAELLRYLYRRTGDRDRAQDLAQETFARALSAEPAAPRAWLFRVATNLLRDEYRGAVRRRRHLQLLANDRPGWTSGPDVEAEVDRERRRARVREALDRLTERDREVLLLWESGLSYAEIASATGLAQGAIGTTLARARRRLATALEGREEHDVAYR